MTRSALLCLSAYVGYAQLADKVELVQIGVQSHSQRDEDDPLNNHREFVDYLDKADRASAMAERNAVMAEMEKQNPVDRFLEPNKRKKAYNSFDCRNFPLFCKAPFNCQGVDLNVDPASSMKPVARDGHPFLGAWCGFPQQFNYVKACIRDKKGKKAAELYRRSEDNKGNAELEASKCFALGHCSNAVVNENTTLAQAEKMCDARFGHDGWAYWVPGLDRGLMSMRSPLKSILMDKQNGHKDPKIIRYLAKLSCAMGTYHCDVMTCKETYCQEPEYIKKYKKLQPVTPGHLLVQRVEPL